MPPTTDRAAFWDDAAERYAAKPVDDPAAFERKIAVTRSHLSPSSRVLDVGCGTGSLALRLAPDAAEVHGLDVSGEMLRIARSKAQSQGVPNVTFHQGTLETAPFDAGSLDVVCAYSLLHLVEDRPAALDTIHRLLRPGGVFISSTVCLGVFPYGPLLTVMRWFGKAPRVWLFPTTCLEAEVRAAGFVELTAPDVGARPPVHFLVARKPS